jgi:hypothetical protein
MLVQSNWRETAKAGVDCAATISSAVAAPRRLLLSRDNAPSACCDRGLVADVAAPHPVDQELVDAAESVAVGEFNERFDTCPGARAGQGGQGGEG